LGTGRRRKFGLVPETAKRCRSLLTALPSGPALDDHRHAESRPQCNQRPRLNAVTGHKVETIALCECPDDELGFDEREVIADALARTGAERQVDEFRTIGALFRGEGAGVGVPRG